jgi:hypothetical protein
MSIAGREGRSANGHRARSVSLSALKKSRILIIDKTGTLSQKVSSDFAKQIILPRRPDGKITFTTLAAARSFNAGKLCVAARASFKVEDFTPSRSAGVMGKNRWCVGPD